MPATTNSHILKDLEELVTGRRITVGHVVIEALPVPSSAIAHTLKNMAKEIVPYIPWHCDGSNNIHAVFDKYNENSIKNATHQK